MSFIYSSPFFASALQFAFEKATIEGKITIAVLILVSLFSWTVIITKIFQLSRARTSVSAPVALGVDGAARLLTRTTCTGLFFN